jgi:hypothetical protein
VLFGLVDGNQVPSFVPAVTCSFDGSSPEWIRNPEQDD